MFATAFCQLNTHEVCRQKDCACSCHWDEAMRPVVKQEDYQALSLIAYHFWCQKPVLLSEVKKVVAARWGEDFTLLEQYSTIARDAAIKDSWSLRDFDELWVTYLSKR